MLYLHALVLHLVKGAAKKSGFLSNIFEKRKSLNVGDGLHLGTNNTEKRKSLKEALLNVLSPSSQNPSPVLSPSDEVPKEKKRHSKGIGNLFGLIKWKKIQKLFLAPFFCQLTSLFAQTTNTKKMKRLLYCVLLAVILFLCDASQICMYSHFFNTHEWV